MVTYQIEIEAGRVPKGGAATILRDLAISGEIVLRPTGSGKWLLEICSETELTEERLKAFGNVTRFSGVAGE